MTARGPTPVAPHHAELAKRESARASISLDEETAAAMAERAQAGKALAKAMVPPPPTKLEKRLGNRIEIGRLGSGKAYRKWEEEHLEHHVKAVELRRSSSQLRSE